MDEQSDGQTDLQTVERADGQPDGQTAGTAEEQRTELTNAAKYHIASIRTTEDMNLCVSRHDRQLPPSIRLLALPPTRPPASRPSAYPLTRPPVSRPPAPTCVYRDGWIDRVE